MQPVAIQEPNSDGSEFDAAFEFDAPKWCDFETETME